MEQQLARKTQAVKYIGAMSKKILSEHYDAVNNNLISILYNTRKC